MREKHFRKAFGPKHCSPLFSVCVISAVMGLLFVCWCTLMLDRLFPCSFASRPHT